MCAAGANHKKQAACDNNEDSFHDLHSSTLMNCKKSRRPALGRLWEEIAVPRVRRYSAWAPLMRMP
jgi:hypothetical protein